MKRPSVRWAPAVVVPAVIATGALISSAGAGAADLEPRTPAQVLALLAASDVQAFAGTLEQTSELGLPTLPDGALAGSAEGSAATAVLELLTGERTARVYADGPSNLRVQVFDTLTERDVVRRGDEVWLYDYEANEATRLELPDAPAGHAASLPGAGTPDGVPTPAELADRFVALVDDTTEVAVGAGVVVAGRDAYDLVLSPRSADTLIGSVVIAVDAETGLPLSVAVHARGQEEPAARVAFTRLTLGAPDPALFSFTPPPGAQVEEVEPPQPGLRPPAGTGLDRLPAVALPTVTGSGWDTVVALPVAAVPPELAKAPLVAQLTRAVDGGRALETAVVTVLLTEDGRALVGAVPLERLQDVAAGR